MVLIYIKCITNLLMHFLHLIETYRLKPLIPPFHALYLIYLYLLEFLINYHHQLFQEPF